MKTYARIFLAGLLIMTLAYHAALRLERNAGERESAAEMIDAQFAADGLYMGLIHSPADYKLAVYARLRPEVAIIGSSRAMKFTQPFFRRPIYNLGGLVYSTGQALGLMRELAALHRPRLMIYAVDFWTLCAFPDNDPLVAPPVPARASAPFWPSQVNRLRLAVDLLADGRMSAAQALELLEGRQSPTAGGLAMVGLTAALQHYGFATDGAIHSALPQQVGPPDSLGRPAWFAVTHNRIINGEGQFPLGCRPYPAAMDQLRQMRTEAQALGIELILVAPPVAGLALDDMAAQAPGATSYMDFWLGEMGRLGDSPVVLAHDARGLGSPDEEFEDGIHGGYVTYARLMLAMAERAPQLRSMMDDATPRRVIERHAGQSKLTLQDLRRLAGGGADRP
ncbi:MAG: hypothetical protein HY055_09180 [Magnetospirillum sp.]|nr:hypothetical protein [Magnetospirillum sp.]